MVQKHLLSLTCRPKKPTLPETSITPRHINRRLRLRAILETNKMAELDDRYITVFGYDLTGAVIERIETNETTLELYLSTHRMEIPENVPRTRNDGCYALFFRGIQVLRSEFPLATAETRERL